MSQSKWWNRLRGIFGSKKNQKGHRPELRFASLTVVEKTPPNDSIGENDFVAVVYQEHPYWALFRCPCGCGSVISLSLQKIHNPGWTVTITGAGRPTLHPSVWRNNGCCSHFWIKDGYVHWCSNSGIAPWVAEPEYYSKRQ
ncbi:DUF6527 family protein [Geomonas diazotrophica]|uniref:DUF6527 family protein n=1 Tax=Geomonas diazotrophica TaxID=2843197 RepID=UPI0034621C97